MITASKASPCRKEVFADEDNVVLQVQDLHAVSPRSFLEVAGGIVHGLSYQQARNNTSKIGQVYVAEPGYMLSRGSVPKGAIITKLAGNATPDMAAFAAALGALRHGQRVPLQYFLFSERHRQKTAILHVDHRWCALRCHTAEHNASSSLMTLEDFGICASCAVCTARACTVHADKAWLCPAIFRLPLKGAL